MAGFFNPALKKTFKNSIYYNDESQICKKNLKVIQFTLAFLLNIFDGMVFGLYTAKYENTEQIFHASTGRDFYNAVAGADGAGMDDANHVHDEILVKLRRGINQFLWFNGFDGAIYYIYNHPICYIYRNHICL